MFSTCSFVCPSVRWFLRSSVANLWTLYFENECTDLNANWHKSSPGARAWTVDLGGQEVKGHGHMRLKLDLEAWLIHHFRPTLSTVDWGKVSDENVAAEKGST